MAIECECGEHRYSDNYAVYSTSTGLCKGTEHNETEAKALARWLSRNGDHHAFVRNPRNMVDQVRASGRKPFRHAWREEAFEELGVM